MAGGRGKPNSKNFQLHAVCLHLIYSYVKLPPGQRPWPVCCCCNSRTCSPLAPQLGAYLWPLFSRTSQAAMWMTADACLQMTELRLEVKPEKIVYVMVSMRLTHL